VSTTIVLRVALAMVVWSVNRALQVHAREGMPGLELVEPRGSSLLRPGCGRVGLAFLPEDVPLLTRLRSRRLAQIVKYINRVDIDRGNCSSIRFFCYNSSPLNLYNPFSKIKQSVSFRRPRFHIADRGYISPTACSLIAFRSVSSTAFRSV